MSRSTRDPGLYLALSLMVLGPVLAGAALPELARDQRNWGGATVLSGPFPKVLSDARGAPFVLEKPPERVVSSVLAADEILLELVPPERLVGLTFLVDDPSNTLALAPKSTARVYGLAEPIVALEPDLVVIADYTSAESASLLMASGCPVLRLGPVASFADVAKNIELVGRATGTESKAAALVSGMRQRLEVVRERTTGLKPARVLVWGYGNTYGEGTLQDDIIRAAGGKNVARETGRRGISALGPEAIIALDPDWIVITTPDSKPELGASARLQGEAWSSVAAVGRGSVLAIPSASLSSVTHQAVNAVEALAQVLEDGARKP